MSIPGSALPLLLTSAAGAPAAGDAKSLRFNSADSAYLNRTPSSAGNRKTWTWSGWVKRQPGSFFTLLATSVVPNEISGTLAFHSADYLYVASNNENVSVNVNIRSSALYRDPSAWYHVVCAHDTTESTDSDRVKLYVNGVRVEDFSTAVWPSSNYDSGINRTTGHTIGSRSTIYGDGYLADVHFIDGQALAATDFGEFDATTGAWNPIAYTGSYGTNGFYLDFSDNSSASALGTDSSGNSNDWTVNNITVSAGPLSSSRGTNYDNDSATYTEYGTVSQASGQTLPMSNPSHYQGAALRPNAGGFKVVTTNSATTDFFMGFWIKFDSLVDGHQFGIDLQGSYKYFEVRSDGTARIRHTGGAATDSSSGVLVANTWQHLALSRSGSTLYGFVNGTMVVSTTSGVTGDSISANEDFNFFGVSGTTYNTNAYIIDAVIYIGAGRSTSFTAPSSPLISSTGTINDVASISSSSRYYASPLISVGDSASGIDSLADFPTNGTQTDTGAGGEVSGNYCTLNPLAVNSATLSNGNLDVSYSTSTSGYRTTIYMESGKWYWEVTPTAIANLITLGVLDASSSLDTQLQKAGSTGVGYRTDGQKEVNGSGSSYGASFTVNDVIGVALDIDGGTIEFYKNGSSQGSISYTFTGKQWSPIANSNNNGTHSLTFNFGQRAFAYTAPSGFKALCTANFDTPTIEDPSTVMDVKLWTGTASSLSVTGYNLSPDFVWIKNRTDASQHHLYDVIRGIGKRLSTSSTAAEDDYASSNPSSSLLSFDSTGFTVGDFNGINGSGDGMVGWAWDAGTSTATNTSGTITSQVRANTSAGFSIVTFGPGAQGDTVGHGLGVAPDLIIVKQTDASSHWPVYHSALGNNNAVYLNLTNAAVAGNYYWNSTDPTSSVFTIGPDGDVKDDNKVAYCWAAVEGYSAFGTYAGNGSNDGPFVYTGFQPKFLLFKPSSIVEQWNIRDAERNTYNPAGARLYPNLANAESTANNIDLLSNGFKVRGNSNQENASGATYIWAAFAESPFAYARAR